MFFAPRNPDTALGMYSSLYFIVLLICLTLIAYFLIISKNMTKKQVKRRIIFIGVFLWVTEIGKMIFTGITYGIKDVEFIPLYYCSMFMYACVMISFKNEHIKNACFSYMFFGGIIGAIAFFCYPNACIPNYPLFHYMTLRTFIYHSLMIYVGVLIVITKIYVPDIKHFKEYAIFLIITFCLAYIYNTIFGKNLMYISYPLDLQISQVVFNAVPKLYPLIFATLELVGPFFGSYLIYRLICKNSKSLKIKEDLCLN